jgi:hypothetical protein
LTISEEAKNYAEATFMKKRMYYNMRIKTIQRLVSNLISGLNDYRTAKVGEVYTNLGELIREVKAIDREVDERTLLPPVPEGHQFSFTFDGAKENALDSYEAELLQNQLSDKRENV